MRYIFVAVLMWAMSTPAFADVVETACLKSPRDAANRPLCGCIQDVADLTLSKSDQRRAARFFTDPNEAQTVRQSDARRDEEFWDRYLKFGNYAQTYCS